MQKNEIVNEWLNYANMDMISAQYLTSLKPMPYEIICYHCQQTVEKLLKAYIIFNDGELLRTHDLIELNTICSTYCSDFSNIMDNCINLNDYSVQVRYPYHQFDIEEIDVENALKDMEIINNFVRKRIKE